MPTKTSKKAVDTTDYGKLLKDAKATKTVTVELPTQSGTMNQIVEKNESALKKEGWAGEEYTISAPTYGYVYYSRNHYVGRYMMKPAKASFERVFTEDEISKATKAQWTAWNKKLKSIENKRIKNLKKLNELQTALGLPLTEGA